MAERNAQSHRIDSELNHKILLIDGSIFIFRAWFGWPDRFHDQQGHPVNAVIGFVDFVLRLLTMQPLQPVFCFDTSLFTGLRHQLDPLYKANRALPDAVLEYQMQQCFEWVEALGLPCLKSEQYEADDLIASVQSQWFAREPVVLVTADKDVAQLVRESDRLWDGKATNLSDYDQVAGKWQIRPEQIAELLALTGDSSDNIPGLRGVGLKTAAQMLNEFGSLTAVIDRPERILRSRMCNREKIHAQICEHRQRLALNYQLTRLYRDAPLPEKPEPWSPSVVHHQRLSRFLALMPLLNKQKLLLQGLL